MRVQMLVALALVVSSGCSNYNYSNYQGAASRGASGNSLAVSSGYGDDEAVNWNCKPRALNHVRDVMGQEGTLDLCKHRREANRYKLKGFTYKSSTFCLIPAIRQVVAGVEKLYRYQDPTNPGGILYVCLEMQDTGAMDSGEFTTNVPFSDLFGTEAPFFPQLYSCVKNATPLTCNGASTAEAYEDSGYYVHGTKLNYW